tara:strand:- start:21240 stop:21380 length:141 start_codon:yes stop_codon:yes gene_type:complete
MLSFLRKHYEIIAMLLFVVLALTAHNTYSQQYSSQTNLAEQVTIEK